MAALRAHYRRLIEPIHRGTKIRPMADVTIAELEFMADLIEICTEAEAKLNRSYKKYWDKLPAEAPREKEEIRRAKLVPREKEEIRRAKKPRPSFVPYGTYGEWDYPNREWPKEPTVADVPEICRQKLQREPNSNLWTSEERTTEWLKTREERLKEQSW